MGCCIDVAVHNVVIPADKAKDCLDAINGLHQDVVMWERGSSGNWVGGERVGASYSWVINPGVDGFTSLVEALVAWRWDASERIDGNVVIRYFTGERAGDEDVLFEAIAPYMEPGGYIMFHEEDGAVWRYLFEDGNLYEQDAIISWG